MPCATTLEALHDDWVATQDLIARYGTPAEINPVIRAVGPDPYFAIWTLGVAALCKEDRQWQDISLFIWAIETWAVNTHYQTGTVHGFPLLLIQIDAGSDGSQSQNSRIDMHLFSKWTTPHKDVIGKTLSEHLMVQVL